MAENKGWIMEIFKEAKKSPEAKMLLGIVLIILGWQGNWVFLGDIRGSIRLLSEVAGLVLAFWGIFTIRITIDNKPTGQQTKRRKNQKLIKQVGFILLFITIFGFAVNETLVDDFDTSLAKMFASKASYGPIEPSDTPTPSETPTYTPSPSNTLTPSDTPLPSDTPTDTPTLSAREQDRQQIEAVINRLIDEWDLEDFPSNWAEYTTSDYRRQYLNPEAPIDGIFRTEQLFVNFWTGADREIVSPLIYDWASENLVRVDMKIIYGDREIVPHLDCVYYFALQQEVENGIGTWYVNADKSSGTPNGIQICPKD